MTIKNISYGANNWDQLVMQNLDDLYAGGGYTDSNWQTCASLVNGAHAYNVHGDATTAAQDARAVRRRIIDFKKFKMVLISGEITANNFKNLTKTTFVKLPSGYPVDFANAFGMVAPGSTQQQHSSFVRWYLNQAGTELTYIGGNITAALPDDANFWLPINIWYLSK